MLPLTETAAMLEAAGIPFAATLLAASPDEAARLAKEHGVFPVVVKAAGLAHKTEAGGVVTGVDSPERVREVAADLVARLGDRALPLLVQEQLTGVEVLVGISREPGLGALVLVGIGGVAAEVDRDVASALAPLTAREARALPERLRGFPRLRGYRGAPGVDLEALAGVLAAVSALAVRRTDLAELDLNPVLVGPPGSGRAVAVDALAVAMTEPAVTPRRVPAGAGLDRVLNPGRIVVVGASRNPAKAGSKVVLRLREQGYAGTVETVHPSGLGPDGTPCASSLAEVTAGPDLVCVAVPAAATAEAVAASVGVGAGGVVVFSSGYAEAGPAGRARQDELTGVLGTAPTRLCGPNLIGLVTPATGAAVTFGSALERAALRPGQIALVSASGGIGGCVASRIAERGGGISRWLNIGNEADVDTADHLAFLADDPLTTVVGLAIERVKDGPTFVEACRRVRAAGKPVFVHKAGRTPAGRRAVSSHTGALVGSNALHDALFRRAGAVRVPTLADLEDVLLLAGRYGAGMRGSRLAVLASSGGVCGIVSDEASGTGLDLTDPSASLRAAIAAKLPPETPINNPIDVTAQVLNEPTLLGDVLALLCASSEYDAVLVQLTTNTDPQASGIAEAVIGHVDRSPVPVLVSRLGAPGSAPDALAAYREAGVPVLTTPENAVRAVTALFASHRVDDWQA